MTDGNKPTAATPDKSLIEICGAQSGVQISGSYITQRSGSFIFPAILQLHTVQQLYDITRKKEAPLRAKGGTFPDRVKYTLATYCFVPSLLY